jgi:hypothetical protein
MRKAIDQQLRHLARNLNHIKKLREISAAEGLSNRQLCELLIPAHLATS